MKEDTNKEKIQKNKEHSQPMPAPSPPLVTPWQTRLPASI